MAFSIITMKYYKIINKKTNKLAGVSLNPMKLKDYLVIEISRNEHKQLTEQLWKQVQNG